MVHLADSTSNENRSSEEGLITCRKRTLKSGMGHMVATQVKKRINWPHEGVLTADSKPAVYSDLTLMVFVWGYLMVPGMKMDTRVKAYMSQQ